MNVIEISFFISARILKWDSPRNGNARAFKRLPENTRSVTEIQKVILNVNYESSSPNFY